MYLYRDNVAYTDKTFNTGNFRGINKINNTPAYAIGVDYDGTFNLEVGNGVIVFTGVTFQTSLPNTLPPQALRQTSLHQPAP